MVLTADLESCIATQIKVQQASVYLLLQDAFQGRGEQWSCKCYSRASTPLRAVPHHINGTIWQSAEAAGLGGWIEHGEHCQL